MLRSKGGWICHKCRKITKTPLKCVKCNVYYCNRICQRTHWKEHKKECSISSSPEYEELHKLLDKLFEIIKLDKELIKEVKLKHNQEQLTVLAVAYDWNTDKFQDFILGNMSVSEYQECVNTKITYNNSDLHVMIMAENVIGHGFIELSLLHPL
jgi:hypothetical protein